MSDERPLVPAGAESRQGLYERLFPDTQVREHVVHLVLEMNALVAAYSNNSDYASTLRQAGNLVSQAKADPSQNKVLDKTMSSFRTRMESYAAGTSGAINPQEAALNEFSAIIASESTSPLLGAVSESLGHLSRRDHEGNSKPDFLAAATNLGKNLLFHLAETSGNMEPQTAAHALIASDEARIAGENSIIAAMLEQGYRLEDVLPIFGSISEIQIGRAVKSQQVDPDVHNTVAALTRLLVHRFRRPQSPGDEITKPKN